MTEIIYKYNIKPTEDSVGTLLEVLKEGNWVEISISDYDTDGEELDCTYIVLPKEEASKLAKAILKSFEEK